ncbi:AraC family transcriptional regulator [Kribbella sp. WER1]
MARTDIPRSPTGALLMVQLAEDHGVDAPTALRGSGLDLEQLHDPQAVVRAEQELRIVHNLLAAAGDVPGLALQAGARFRLTSYGIWGFALLSSRTLRSAIDVALQFLELTFAFCEITARRTAGEMQLVVDGAERFLVERDMAGVQTIQRDLFATPLPLARVTFAFPAPAEIAPYREVFGGTPQFGAAQNVIAWDAALLDAALPQANAATLAMATAQCRELVQSRRARAGLAGRVRDLLLAEIAHPPNAGQVAARLYLSDRTLRERLAAEGTSFRGLLDEIRERLAEELLLKGVPVTEIAQSLGYVELSSFSQAFRRWKGSSPRAYRASFLTR